MGVGMILVVDEKDVDSVLSKAEGSYLIGEIVDGEREAVMV